MIELTGTYPRDTNWRTLIDIPKTVVVAFVEAMGETIEPDRYLNKGFSIIKANFSDVVGIYKHDFVWYLIEKQYEDLTEEERVYADKCEAG